MALRLVGAVNAALRLVDLMGGEIGAESVEGKGSIFWWTLKLARSQESTPAIHETRDFKRRRVLIVDDDPMLIKSLQDTLQEDGHQITATHHDKKTKLHRRVSHRLAH